MSEPLVIKLADEEDDEPIERVPPKKEGPYSKVGMAERLEIVQRAEKGDTPLEIATALGRPACTVRRVINKFRPSTALAERWVRAQALPMVMRMIRQAGPDLLADVLSRPNIDVLKPAAPKNGPVVGIFSSIKVESLGAVSGAYAVSGGRTVALEGEAHGEYGAGDLPAATGHAEAGAAPGPWIGRELRAAHARDAEADGPALALGAVAAEHVQGRDGASAVKPGDRPVEPSANPVRPERRAARPRARDHGSPESPGASVGPEHGGGAAHARRTRDRAHRGPVVGPTATERPAELQRAGVADGIPRQRGHAKPRPR